MNRDRSGAKMHAFMRTPIDKRPCRTVDQAAFERRVCQLRKAEVVRIHEQYIVRGHSWLVSQKQHGQAGDGAPYTFGILRNHTGADSKLTKRGAETTRSQCGTVSIARRIGLPIEKFANLQPQTVG